MRSKFYHRGSIWAFNSDNPFLDDIFKAAESLSCKMQSLDLANINISEYNRRYLTGKINHITSTLQLYAYILHLAICRRNTALDELTIVDYGGGTGVLSLLAKELGIGRVIYNDIYEVSCHDFKVISGEIGIQPDDVVCGDIDALPEYIRECKIDVDTLCSYDVIEHIYDIEDFFIKLYRLSDSLRVVCGSGANIKNPVIRSALMKQHHWVENHDRENVCGYKNRDTLKSYRSVRADIIESHFPSLDRGQKNYLVKMTRGLAKQDIQRCGDDYLTNGVLGYKPKHPTNTCDPLTGNWNEQLIDLDWIEHMMLRIGYRSKVLCGYWADSKSKYKMIIKFFLNLVISLSNDKALCCSGWYIIFADSSAEQGDIDL